GGGGANAGSGTGDEDGRLVSGGMGGGHLKILLQDDESGVNEYSSIVTPASRRVIARNAQIALSVLALVPAMETCMRILFTARPCRFQLRTVRIPNSIPAWVASCCRRISPSATLVVVKPPWLPALPRVCSRHQAVSHSMAAVPPWPGSHSLYT